MDSNRVVLVIGLGASNLAVIQWFNQNRQPYLAWDSDSAVRTRLRQSGYEILEETNNIDWSNVSRVVLSPGVPYHFPHKLPLIQRAEDLNIPIVGDIALLFETIRKKTQPIISIGITGTNGKSTTTALVAEIIRSADLKAIVGGNIGIPVMDLPLDSEFAVVLLELSSYQLDLEIGNRLSISALLNITPDHLDRHGGMEGYVSAKKKIFDHQTENDFAILAVDDEDCQEIARSIKNSKLITVSTSQSLHADYTVVSDCLVDNSQLPGAKLYDFNRSKYLHGQHNYQNAAVAYAIAKALNIDDQIVFACFDRFNGLPHRQEPAGVFRNMSFINDSKATNADASAPALKTFRNIVWLLGGVEKSGGIESLMANLDQVKFAIAYGKSRNVFFESLKRNSQINSVTVETLEQAVRQAVEYCDSFPGVEFTILLSPAAASFDQFNNFEHRGETFKNIVTNYFKSENSQ